MSAETHEPTEISPRKHLPTFTVVFMPKGRTPTLMVDTGGGNLCSFQAVGFHWCCEMTTDALLQGRVHFLASTGDDAGPTPIVYIPNPRDLDESDNVDYLEFPYTDIDGTTERIAVWNRDDGVSLTKCLNDIAEDLVSGSGLPRGAEFDEKKKKMYNYLRKAKKVPLKRATQEKRARIAAFFEPLEWESRSLTNMRLYKLYPINAKVIVNSEFPDKHFRSLQEQLQDKKRLVTNHHLLASGVTDRINKRKLATLYKVDCEWE
jgi:hypothetical protein